MPSAPDRSAGAAAAHPPVLLLAIAAGAVVANLYYNQPLLGDIARDLAVPEPRVGLVATATQLGYALGLLLVVPLADVAERRRLVVGLTLGTAVALAACAVAPGVGWLTATSFALGVASVVPQVLVPLAAGLAGPATRGRAVGTVMSGLLIGILLARVVSGALGAALGWRPVFWLAAGAMLVLAAVLRARLPRSAPTTALAYGALLGTLPRLAARHATLREAAVIGALAFASFSAFWTTLAFHLAAPPLRLGSAAAGAFGLVGVVGALASSAVGRLNDRGRPGRTVGIGLAVAALAWGVFLVGGQALTGLVVGVVLLDLGAQASHVSNQARIFALEPTAHGRVNAVYMVSCFVGAALGSSLGTWAWGRAGWPAVVALGLACVAVAAAVHARGALQRRALELPA
jgi:predicted MFS family arabinose efflux permease